MNIWGIAAGYLTALGVIFMAMARVAIPMVFGLPPDEGAPAHHRTPFWFAWPAMAMTAVILALGLYVPDPLWSFLGRAVALTRGGL